MRSESPCRVSCNGLCQHPECWRSNLQQVREAVWRRNGVEPQETSRGSSVKMDAIYLRKEQRVESNDGGLPTLKIVDMMSELDGSRRTPRNHLKPINPHQRSASLPSMPSASASQESSPKPIKSPHPSPALTSPALTEYQRRMKWKKQSRVETATSRASTNSVKVSTIAVHELYEQDELDQEWQEVYVTSAYLVWCPSNKKRRKKRESSSKSSSASSTKHHYKVIPKDVTEDFVPASLEITKPCRPKSTKTPTGGQPFSPHRPTPNPRLTQYGMEDLSNLPRPVLSGILQRINWRSNEVSPIDEPKSELPKISTKEPDNTKDLALESFCELLTKEEGGSRMRLAVDINSRFTTPEEDEQIEEQRKRDNAEKEDNSEAKEGDKNLNENLNVGENLNEVKTGRDLLPMHSIGVPIEDLPAPKHHHCTSSIPRRMSLGVALEPVNLVPVTPSPATTSRGPLDSNREVPGQAVQPTESIVVNVPSGRPESAPIPVPYGLEHRYYINSAFRYTPSPVRAPAPTPISPDKYSESVRYSRTSQSRRRSSSHDEETSRTMRRWNTLSNVFDTDESVCKDDLEDPFMRTRGTPVGNEVVLPEFPEGRVFLTEGIEPTTESAWPTTKMTVHLMDNPSGTPRGRSPSPGSRTCIPRDIIEQFHGDLYGMRYPRTEPREMKQQEGISTSRPLVLGAGIITPGWRPPRSRTPVQFAETPARFPPRPLRQPPLESIPKSLQIVSISKPKRPKSTPPRVRTPFDDGPIPLVLSDSSLVNQSTGSAVSMEVRIASSNVTDSGSVPPPPSPEAPAALRNDLHLTLETLCEEDERSSRTTSIADVFEKGVTSSRLSPLGGGSEMSEESVDLPNELSEINDSTEDELKFQQDETTTTEPPLAQTDEKENVDFEQENTSNDETTEGKEKLDSTMLVGGITTEAKEKRFSSSSEPNAPRGSPEPHPPRGSSEPHPSRGNPEPHPPRGSLEPHPPRGSPETHPPRGSPEPHPPRGSPEPHPPRGSPEPHPPRGTPEPHPPCGSPEPHPPRVFPGPHPPRGSPEPHPPRVSPEPHPPRGFPEPHPPRGSPEPHPPRGSPEPHPPRGSPEPHQPRGSPGSNSPPRGSPEPGRGSPEPQQRPGSPDVNSNQDFTEGLDMELDLAAELQAAMAGLDDFSLEDDDDEALDDDTEQDTQQ